MTRFLLEVIPRARLREGRSWIPMPGGLRLIDRGAFARFVEKEHLLLRTDGLQPPKEYLDGFVYGALAYRLYLRETADRQRMGRE